MNKEIDLVSVPKKSFWKLSIPIIAFCLFDAIYGIVDMLWVSRISVEAFYAIGVSIPITSLIFSFGDSIGQGTNSMMSRFLGTGDYESAYNTLIHGMIISNLIWVLLVLCLLFAQGILYRLDSGDSYVLIFDYLVPMVVFAYIFMLNNLFSETFQAEGNSHTPTILIIASNILNIILDPIFIFDLNLGIKGAAYASVLSSMITFTILFYMYTHGRTKIPLSLKYFKFRSYILVEIFKVALPNFLDDAIWSFTMSFINVILIGTMGAIGPILYSVSNKIRTLLNAPVKGYGRGLMSVTGHLFGAERFDKLEEMYNYVLKIAVSTAFVIIIAFFFIRNYAFSLFSITDMDNAIFWISAAGIVINTIVPISTISSKMLDGFGKSLYSLTFTIIKVAIEIVCIYIITQYITDGSSVLIGIVISEICSSIIYYKFLRYLFNHFDEEYELKYTVRAFTIKRKEKIEKLKERREEWKEEKREEIEELRERREEKIEEFKEKREEKIEEFKEKREEKIEEFKEKREEKREE
ncbi:MATE family efflux transporter, partial [Methanobrevibacter sp.]|uniref:MATE family efflux transporter n=1 Tax=Methanobrevibacter sp. TaxID=66852 RepID=UPI00388D7CAF